MVPNTQLRLAGLMRKLANGHSTATSTPTNNTPETTACSHGPQPDVRDQNQSSASAGAISSTGNSGGMKCVTFWYTGPSFGTAGNSGRIHTQPIRNRV